MSQLYATNLGKNVTATDLGAGKIGLDVSTTMVEGATAANGGALPTPVKVVAGYDGAAVRVLATDNTGKLNVNVSTSALPTGAATETTLSALNTKVTACNTGAVVVSSGTITTITNDVGVKPNNHGEHNTSSIGTVASVSAPVGAIGFIFSADDTNDANIRVSIGGTASATSGMQYQPGRDTGYVPAACDVSLCAESGTQKYTINWIKRS